MDLRSKLFHISRNYHGSFHLRQRYVSPEYPGVGKSIECGEIARLSEKSRTSHLPEPYYTIQGEDLHARV
jgi:hypothetical protein